MATYIDYLNNFNRWLESGNLPGGSQLMYFKLLNVFNRAGWPEYVRVDNLRMMLMIGVESKQAVVRARDKLAEAGFIEFQKGKKGSPNRYYLVKRSHFVTENVTVSVPENVTVSVPENVPHNKNETKTTSLVSPNGSTKTKPTFEHGSLPYRAPRWLADQIEERLPNCTAHSETTLQNWAADFDKCHRLDGHSWEDIDKVLQFSQFDSFWQSNILSGGKFRKQYTQLLAKMGGGT